MASLSLCVLLRESYCVTYSWPPFSEVSALINFPYQKFPNKLPVERHHIEDVRELVPVLPAEYTPPCVAAPRET